jgi:hypothetical protein
MFLGNNNQYTLYQNNGVIYNNVQFLCFIEGIDWYGDYATGLQFLAQLSTISIISPRSS